MCVDGNTEWKQGIMVCICEQCCVYNIIYPRTEAAHWQSSAAEGLQSGPVRQKQKAVSAFSLLFTPVSVYETVQGPQQDPALLL